MPGIKTLKDLYLDNLFVKTAIELHSDKCKFVDYERLREVAINWIKLIRDNPGKYGPIIPIKPVGKIKKTIDGIPCCDGFEISKESINFIKHFFNISEDDLKW